MTNEQMERAIEFLLDHHARFSVGMEDMRAGMQDLRAGMEELRHGQKLLQETQEQQAGAITRLTNTVEQLAEEMREGFNNLIVANEVTRDLAEKAARLAIATSQRVTVLETASSNPPPGSAG